MTISNEEEKNIETDDYSKWSDEMLTVALYVYIEDLSDYNNMLIAVEEECQRVIEQRTAELNAIKAERDRRKEQKENDEKEAD